MHARLAAAVVLAFVGVTSAAAPPISFSRTDYPNDSGSRGIVAADFDGDGAPDLATANSASHTVTIFLNRLSTGGGLVRAHTYAVAAGPFGIAASDINHDGRIDLVVAAADADQIELLMGLGNGAFVRLTPLGAPGNPRAVTIADVDTDGNSDLIYTSFLLDTVAVLFGDGMGAFPSMVVFPTGAKPQAVVASDFNGDQHVDLAIANTAGTGVTLLTGDGSGAFARTDLQGANNLNVLATGDFNHDGRPDLAAASTSRSTVAIYLNGASGLQWATTFSTGLSSPRGIAVADLNGDRLPDLIVANRVSNLLTIFVASAAPTVYTTPVTVTAAAGSRAVAVADFNRDGRLDFAVGNDTAGAVSVFSNRATYPGVGAVAWELYALPPADPAFFRFSTNITIAYFNRNGSPDVVAGGGVVLDGGTPVKVGIDRQNQTYLQTVAGDFNGDGHADFARFTEYGPDPVNKAHGLDVFLGDGTGQFVFDRLIPIVGLPSAMVAGDVNGDGRTDILFEDGSFRFPTRRRLLVGTINGAFTEIDTDISGTRFFNPFGFADLNRDGKLDLFTMSNDVVVVWLGDGTGRFPSSMTSPLAGIPDPFGPAIGDLNEDGIPDVVAGNSNGAVWLGRADGTFAEPTHPLFGPAAAFDLLADLTGDGHLDLLRGGGGLLEGRGDGTFLDVRPVNIEFSAAAGADIDRDGLIDVVLAGQQYAAMVLFNRKAPGPQLAPVAVLDDLTLTYSDQFTDAGEEWETRSYDPNLDPLTFRWFDATGAEVGTSNLIRACCHPPGTYRFTLVARDDHGMEARHTATLTIVPTQEIVIYADQGFLEGAWQLREDPTAADGASDWHPNANAPKLTAPLRNPTNTVNFEFIPDPTQEYKLWIRLKAQGDSWANDSIFVQFGNAVDALGNSMYQIGTASALAVNLEECIGCGESGWGWRDDAWGAKGLVSRVVLRFPNTDSGPVATIRIQTREDGVMVDQIVLSSNKYKTTRPGRVKNDTTILRASPRP